MADKRIGCVQSVASSLDHELSVEFVGAWLREDFNASVAELIVLGRERILIDANFPNRRFRRKLSGGETINIDLSAVGTRGRTGQCGQLVLHFVGIVGKSFEVLAADGDGI